MFSGVPARTVDVGTLENNPAWGGFLKEEGPNQRPALLGTSGGDMTHELVHELMRRREQGGYWTPKRPVEEQLARHIAGNISSIGGVRKDISPDTARWARDWDAALQLEQTMPLWQQLLFGPWGLSGPKSFD